MQSPILRPFPAKFSPAARSPVRRLLPLSPIRRPDYPPPPLAASASGDIDAFTKYSGYLFESSDSSEAEFPRDYDLRAIAAIYRRKPFLVLRRSLQIGSLLGRWLAVRYFDSVLERSDEMFKTRAMELRMILLELGPAFVKIAQAVSSRPDVIPPAYLEELSLLQDRISPFATAVAFSMIEKELGQTIEILFSDISPEPIAAASLGQVLNDYIIYASTKKSVSSQTTRYWKSCCCQSSEARCSSSNFFRYIYPTFYCRGGKKNCQVEYRSSGCN